LQELRLLFLPGFQMKYEGILSLDKDEAE